MKGDEDMGAEVKSSAGRFRESDMRRGDTVRCSANGDVECLRSAVLS